MPPLPHLATLSLLLLAGCKGSDEDSGPDWAYVDGLVQVVPSSALPAGLEVELSNNALDLVQHEEEWFLTFRSAPSATASAQAVIHVLRSADQQSWSLEASFGLDTDLGQPRLLSTDESLLLYFALLGSDPQRYEPQGTWYSQLQRDGNWTDPQALFDDDLLIWRVRERTGEYQLLGWAGAAGLEALQGDEQPALELRFLRSSDGLAWEPVEEGRATVQSGGVSQADFVYQDAGDLLAVVNNAAGDDQGFGSLICTAANTALGSWTCKRDTRLFDAPLLFKYASRYWMLARRNLSETGEYDLQMPDLVHQDKYEQYWAAYLGTPKRCALWQVFPEDLVVLHTLDLDSQGDTCSPSAVDLGSGHFTVYNHSSDPEGQDPSWEQALQGETMIYRQELWLP